MKRTLLAAFAATLLAFSAPIAVGAQTAVNFTCNDCAGNNHDLFTELDAGKVIVISWVMPCGSCIGPTITASNIVQSYATSNPGQVFLYVVDDYANTNCTSLGGWCTSNSITATTFSNASIDMLDYNSTPGMPKIVVLGGGTAHSVFFNEVNTAAGDAVAMQAAIDAALATGVNEAASPFGALELFPNPVNGSSTLTVSMNETRDVTVGIYNQLGQHVATAFSGPLQPGENRVGIDVTGLSDGIYFIQVGDGESSRMLKLVVSR